MPESWEQLQEYIQRLKSENEDLATKLAIANDWLSRYEDQYR
jgi:hypothetical protein